MVATGSVDLVSESSDQVAVYVAQAQNAAQNSAVASPPVPVVPPTFPEDTVTISSAAQNMVRALNASGESSDLIAAQLNLPIQSVEDSLSLAATA
jgi:hypothetical protein